MIAFVVAGKRINDVIVFRCFGIRLFPDLSDWAVKIKRYLEDDVMRAIVTESTVYVLIMVVGVISLLIAGCTASSSQSLRSDTMSVTAVLVNEPINIDGELTDTVWQTAPRYTFSLGKDRLASNNNLVEPGYVQCAYDEDYFYLAVSCVDNDIVAEGQADQLHHYQFGDTAELFLKPENASWYWEMYVTPRGNKTVFFFPGRGRLGVPSCFEDQGWGLQVGAKMTGTLNNWQDKDQGWTAEMAVPIEDLTRFGGTFSNADKWTILISRYNFSRYLKNIEMSAFPRLSRTDFHLLDEYAPLDIQ